MADELPMWAKPSVETIALPFRGLTRRGEGFGDSGDLWGCADGVLAFRTVGTKARSLVCWAMLSGTAHADCKPTAIAQGDPALVAPLVAKLAASGIATAAAAGCPVVQGKLEQRGQQVHVRLADAFQRTGERDVPDVATAAAIVESWK